MIEYQPELTLLESRRITQPNEKHDALVRERRDHHENLIRMHSLNDYEKIKRRIEGVGVVLLIALVALCCALVWSR